MPQPGALLPVTGKQIALGSTANTKIPSNAAVRFFVSTAGEISFTYVNSAGDTLVETYPIGVNIIDGSVGEMWVAGGSSLVLVPAVTVTILNS